MNYSILNLDIHFTHEEIKKDDIKRLNKVSGLKNYECKNM